MLDKYLNKITCADSYKAIKEIPDKSIDCIYTDIPYDMEFNGGGCLQDKLGKYIKDEVDYFSNGIDYSILDEFIRVLKNINCFIWCSEKQIYKVMSKFVPTGAETHILTWTKTNPIPFGNSLWLSDIEYCLHFYKQAGYNVGWENKKKNYTSEINQKDKQLFRHATIKPLPMVKRHLLNATKENDIVADFFVGSGTTCVAAKELNRQFIGIEISNEWAKIAQDRINGIDAHGQLSFLLR